ncbi:MAG: hypothetical protein DRP22_02285 [Verrucomicrobia bacterium]|nr:MAG: hypothetical protein DRP22_02285 [Verrucomicrobiota bacterium]
MNKKDQTRPAASRGVTAAHGPSRDEIIRAVREYLLPVGIGLIIGLAIFLGLTVYRYQRERRAEIAFSKLSQARDVAALEEIARDYAHTPASFVALLGAAATYYHSDQFGMALQKYNELLRQFPKHLLSPLGRLGKAYCLEGLGQLEQARAAFEALSSNTAPLFVRDPAAIGAARCLEEMQRPDEARQAYQRFVDSHADSPWAPLARTALLYVDQDLRVADRQETAAPWALPPQPGDLSPSPAEPDSGD